MPKRKDLTGQRFGKLLVLRYSHTEHSKANWVCKCDCGIEKIIEANTLRFSGIKSCGCGQGRRSFHFPKGVAASNRILAQYKLRAKNKNLIFEISDEYARHLMSLNCFYCGRSPSNRYSHKRAFGEFVYNGIDRLDNSKGYVTDNVVPCCRICNMAKKDLSYLDFKNWLFRASDFMLAKEVMRAS